MSDGDSSLTEWLRKEQVRRDAEWARTMSKLERGDLWVKGLCAVALVAWVVVYVLIGSSCAPPPCPAAVCPECPPSIWMKPCLDLDAMGNPYPVPCKLAPMPSYNLNGVDAG